MMRGALGSFLGRTMGKTGRTMQVVALGLCLATAACNKPVAVSKADAAIFHKKRPPLPKPSPTAHLIQLPDSAIFVERGSTEDQLADFLASKAPAPHVFRFMGPEFEPWQSKPNEMTLRTMYAIAQILRAYPHSEVQLIGHTDNDGTPEQNLRLSQARVDRMAQLLIHGGILPRRISAIGHGMSDPIADNGTPEGKARNRRVELVVTRK
jgi:outer membrane protein OmpA-like peptidoglycan-associated protein